MKQTQPSSQLSHHIMAKMGAMVSDNGLRDTKPGNHMIEEKLRDLLTVSCQCRHCFGPFGEVVYDYNNIRIPPCQERVTCHKIDTPLCKRTNSNDRMEVSGWCVHLALVDLALVTFKDSEDTIFENGRPEIPNTKNFFSSSIPRHVTNTCARMAIIKEFFSFLEGQTPTEDRISSDVV